MLCVGRRSKGQLKPVEMVNLTLLPLVSMLIYAHSFELLGGLATGIETRQRLLIPEAADNVISSIDSDKILVGCAR